MKLTFTSKRGRSTISNTVEVDDLNDEENLQEVFLEFFDFLIANGAELPNELLEELENYD